MKSTEDFQSLPVLFYFYTLIERMDIFPVADNAAFLKERIGDIRDLSAGKFTARIDNLLSFSHDHPDLPDKLDRGR